jgi:hypothetical protein
LLGGEYANRSKQIKEAMTPLIDVLNDIIKKGEDECVFRKNVDPLHLYLTIVSLCLFYIATHSTLSNLIGYNFTGPKEMNDRLDHIIDVVLSYLRP